MCGVANHLSVLVEGKPHNSFLDVRDNSHGPTSEGKLERDQTMDFLTQCSQEIVYLMVSPANPPPPHQEPPPSPPPPQIAEEVLLAAARDAQRYQQPHEELPRQQPPQNGARDPIPTRTEPPIYTQAPLTAFSSVLPIRNAEVSAAPSSQDMPFDQSAAPQAASTPEEWSGESDENVTTINHHYDAFGRPISFDAEDAEMPTTTTTEVDGWDFNDAAAFPEPEAQPEFVPTPQRPDTVLFPPAQDVPKSPKKGPDSHRRKGSMSRRRSFEHDISISSTNQQKAEIGNFKVRFGLRGHLDAVRTVIFTGAGSPAEPEICTAGDDGVVKRWVIPARLDGHGAQASSASDLDIQSYFTHRGHNGPVLCLTAYSPSANYVSGGRAQGDGWVFSGGQDASIRVWERGRVDPKATLDGHTDAVWAICVLPATCGQLFGAVNSYGGPDRLLLASGAADGSVRVWSVSAPPQLNSPSAGSGRRGAGGRVRGNSMSSGTGLASPQPSMASTSLFHHTLIHTITRENSDASPTCITPLSESGETFAVSYSDAAVLVYDTKTGEEIVSMASLETYDGTMATSTNAIVATTSGLDSSLSSSSGRGASEDDTIVHGPTGSSAGIEGTIISGHEDRYVRFFDANSGQCCPSSELSSA